jgi:hypothetical protein
MLKIGFTGGSITAGSGWVLPDEQNLMWVNLVHKNCFSDLACVNEGINGASNATVFKESLKLITDNTLAYLICSWLTGPRYHINIGFELYTTDVFFNANNPMQDIVLNTGTISKNYLDSIRNRFLVLHHYHHEIKIIVEYVDIINKLCKQKNIKVYHINDSCVWDKNYFTRLNNVLPEDYTEFTKTSILNVDNRADDEIFKLYNKLHNEYDAAGGIQEFSWINLYSSLKENRIDVNHDNQHPGQKSNFNYYTTVKNFLENQ